MIGVRAGVGFGRRMLGRRASSEVVSMATKEMEKKGRKSKSKSRRTSTTVRVRETWIYIYEVLRLTLMM